MNDKNELTMQIIINVTNDGRVGVAGFPTNLIQAQQILHAANVSMMEYFIGHAKAGRMDDKGTVIESKIIQPNNPIIKLNAKQHMRPQGRKDGMNKK